MVDHPPGEESVSYLRTPRAIRERCRAVLDLGLGGRLRHFSIDLAAIEPTADFVAKVTREAYPDLQVPIHGRFRHFEVGGVDRLRQLRTALAGRSPIERARSLVDLVVPSVLLDAGAGPAWRYEEDGVGYARSEGLAVASFHMFVSGAFSARREASTPEVFRSDAAALRAVTADDLARCFQVRDDNPLVGLAGRAGLVRALGEAVEAHPDLFPGGRVGGMVDVLVRRGQRIEAAEVLALLLEGLSSIWPGRISLDGINLGDVWSHPQVGLVPFHKLSQWLTYSLVEPLAEAGLEVVELDALTGLPEYRNGGLLVDLGVLVPKHDAVLREPHLPGDEIVVEWRALTVALLDRVAEAVRRELQRLDMPLANVLQGGTWTAGRTIAAARRAHGAPPIEITSDGTVF